jgi:hypothetical protein
MRLFPILFTLAIVTGVALLLPATAQDAGPSETAASGDGIVRLPGQGELKGPLGRQGSQGGDRAGPRRLLPGGGLLASFDMDGDGLITTAEIDAGIPLAFASADADGDGYVTPLEQQDWSDSLPTRDDSLANPARFDPNLDRRASLEEFDLVVRQIAGVYRAENAGELSIASLAAPEPKARERRARRVPTSPERLPPRSQEGFRGGDVSYFGRLTNCHAVPGRCARSFGRYGVYGNRLFRIDPYVPGLTFRLRDQTPRAVLIDGTWHTIGPTD